MLHEPKLSGSETTHWLLHIKPIRTGLNHPQTRRLVEPFNQTMLQTATNNEDKDRDKLITNLPIYYSKTTTSIPPFELLNGIAVWGPSDMLKEYWAASSRRSESIACITSTHHAGEADKDVQVLWVSWPCQDTTAEAMVGQECQRLGIGRQDWDLAITIHFNMKAVGSVEWSVFSVDGRLVRWHTQWWTNQHRQQVMHF